MKLNLKRITNIQAFISKGNHPYVPFMVQNLDVNSGSVGIYWAVWEIGKELRQNYAIYVKEFKRWNLI